MSSNHQTADALGLVAADMAEMDRDIKTLDMLSRIHALNQAMSEQHEASETPAQESAEHPSAEPAEPEPEPAGIAGPSTPGGVEQ